MRMNILFSVIIPVYNSENTIKKCIDSILIQNKKNIEIILINDGSTDNSLGICKELEKNFPVVRVINQKNQGVSVARNIGISESSGKYILFIDSDDVIAETYFEEIEKNIEENDFIIFGYTKESCLKKKVNIVNDEVIGIKNVEKLMIEDERIGGYIWNKVFLSKIIKDNNILFEEDIGFGEDLLFVYRYIKYAKKIYYIPKSLYTYIYNSTNTTSNSISDRMDRGLLKVYRTIIDETENEYVANRLKYRYMIEYYQCRNCNDNMYINAIEKEYWKIRKVCNLSEIIKLDFLKKFPNIYMKLKMKKYSCS